SPPKITTRSASPVTSTAWNERNADGVWFNTVTPSSRTSAANASGVRASPDGTTTSRPPYTSAPHISHTEKSNPAEWNIVQVSAAVKWNSDSVPVNKLATLPCVIPTPLGWPVDPDVKMTYASVALVTRHAGAVTGAPS